MSVYTVRVEHGKRREDAKTPEHGPVTPAYLQHPTEVSHVKVVVEPHHEDGRHKSNSEMDNEALHAAYDMAYTTKGRHGDQDMVTKTDIVHLEASKKTAATEPPVEGDDERQQVYAAEKAAIPHMDLMRSVSDEDAQALATKHVGQHVDVIPHHTAEGHLYGRWLTLQDGSKNPVIVKPPGYPLSHHEVLHESAHLIANREGDGAGHGHNFRSTLLTLHTKHRKALAEEYTARGLSHDDHEGIGKTAGKDDPWYAGATDEEIDAHHDPALIRSLIGHHTAPNGKTYRLVNHTGRMVTAHSMPSGRRVGGLTWFGGKKEEGNSISGTIHKVVVSGPHRRKGLATAMLNFARQTNPRDDIFHSHALSDDGRAWSEKVAHQVDLDDWRPHERIFGPGKHGEDPRLFDGEHLKDEVRDNIINTLDAYWVVQYGHQWVSWAKVYFTGSEASHWYGNNDFDVLIGIDYDEFRKCTGSNMQDEEIDDSLNKGFRAHLNGPVTFAGDTFDRTWYVNHDSYDIARLKPYAAYDVVDDYWAVHPVHVPDDWGPDKFPESTWRIAEHYADEIKRISELDPKSRQQYAEQLFEHIHTDRQRAFSERGTGVFDVGNVAEKYLDQRPDHPLALLVEMKNAGVDTKKLGYSHEHGSDGAHPGAVAGKGKPRSNGRGDRGSAQQPGQRVDGSDDAVRDEGVPRQPRRVTEHRAVKKDVKGLQQRLLPKYHEIVKALANNEPHPSTHPLNGPLKGWQGTNLDFNHRIVHKYIGDDELHVGHVGVHYEGAPERLGSLHQAGADTSESYAYKHVVVQPKFGDKRYGQEVEHPSQQQIYEAGPNKAMDGAHTFEHQYTHNGNPVAKLRYSVHPDEPSVINIEGLAVHPDHQRSGLAVRMTDKMQEHAKKHGMVIDHGTYTDQGHAFSRKYMKSDHYDPALHLPYPDKPTETTGEDFLPHMLDEHEMEQGRKMANNQGHGGWIQYYDNIAPGWENDDHDNLAENYAVHGVANHSLGRRLTPMVHLASASPVVTPLSNEEQEARLAPGVFKEQSKPQGVPADHLVAGARAYNAERGMPDPHDIDFSAVHTTADNTRNIGRAYQDLPEHDPAAEPHYDAMRKEIGEQYHHMVHKMGITPEFVKEDPYGSSKEMMADVNDNKRIKVLDTASTGSHPYLSDEENNQFRAIHDVFGHAATGRGFDKHGEEAAFQAHSRMFSPMARPAMETETRGQNHFYNLNGKFAQQKVALLPKGVRQSELPGESARTAASVYR